MNQRTDEQLIEAKFLEFLANDPRYALEIEPDFQWVQRRVLEERGKSFRIWHQEVTTFDPVEEYIWSVTEGRPLHLKLLLIEDYFDRTWQQAVSCIKKGTNS